MPRLVRIINAAIAGGAARAVGETYSGSDAEALVRMGKAEWVADATPAPEFTEPEPAPKPATKKKRGRRKKVEKRGPGN